MTKYSQWLPQTLEIDCLFLYDKAQSTEILSFLKVFCGILHDIWWQIKDTACPLVFWGFFYVYDPMLSPDPVFFFTI